MKKFVISRILSKIDFVRKMNLNHSSIFCEKSSSVKLHSTVYTCTISDVFELGFKFILFISAKPIVQKHEPRLYGNFLVFGNKIDILTDIELIITDNV